MSKQKLLLIGCTGVFGRKFVELYGGCYDIIGVARHIPSSPMNCQFIKADIVREIPKIIAATHARFGAPDILVNAAVVVDLKQLSSRSPSDLLEEFQVNFLAPVSIIKACVETFWSNYPEINRARNRNIVNISSISGSHIINLESEAGWTYATYGAAKAALNSFSLHLAHDLSVKGLRVNAVAPCTFPKNVETEKVCEVVDRVARGNKSGELVEFCGDYEKNVHIPTFSVHA